MIMNQYTNIFKLSIAQLITKLVDNMLLVTSIWFITSNYGKSYLTSLLVISTLPHFFLSFFSGKFIRKYSPLRIIIITDYFRAGLFLIIIFFIIYTPLSPIVFFGTLFLSNCAAAFFNPALLSIPLQLSAPNQLQRVISIISSTVSISSIIGPILAVFFYQIEGIKLIFIIAVIGYFFAASIEMTIKTRGVFIFTNQSKDSLQLITYIKKYQSLFNLLGLFILINVFFIPLQLYMPLYSKFIFVGGIQSLSMMEISLGTGALLATILLSIFRINLYERIKIMTSYLLMGVGYFLFAKSNSILNACIALFFLSFCATIGNIFILNFLQRYPDRSDVPGIMACVNFASIAAAPAGLFLAGVFINLDKIQIQVKNYALVIIVLTLVIGILFKSKRVSEESINYE